MRYLSVCSGIEAASAAWMPLGWQPVAFSEIEPFPYSVLAHHHPNVPNWGDMTKYEEWPDASVDLLCGGTPCQSFSVAGLRKGLADPRGNLMLTFGAIAARYRPRWLVWENVPGVLSSNGGRDFGAFLGLLAELGYGFAYRVLDAQYIRVESHPRAVPQRRRRVFVVGHSGGLWQRAAAVLFERESLCGHPAPRREAGKAAPDSAQDSFGIRSANTSSNGIGVQRGVSHTIDSAGPQFVAHALRGEGLDASEDGTGRGTPLVPAIVGQAMSSKWAKGTAGPAGDEHHNLIPVPFDTTQITSPHNYSAPRPGDACHPLAAGAHAPCIAFPEFLSGTQHASTENPSPALGAMNPTAVQTGMAVRRLTPLECERLMGFTDGHTDAPHNGKPAADGPRYKALGNSWAINCARWIGERIEAVETIVAEQAELETA